MHTTASDVATPESANVQPMLWRGWRDRMRAPTREKAVAPMNEPPTFHQSWVLNGVWATRMSTTRLIGIESRVRPKNCHAAHIKPTIVVPAIGPHRCWRRGSANPRQPGSSVRGPPDAPRERYSTGKSSTSESENGGYAAGAPWTTAMLTG